MKRKFNRYILVGIVNTIIDFGIVNLLYIANKTQNSVMITTYASIAFMISNIISYFLNKHFTFKSYGSYRCFLLSSVITFACNSLFIFCLSHRFNDSVGDLNFIKLISTASCFFINYILYSKFVFRGE